MSRKAYNKASRGRRSLILDVLMFGTACCTVCFILYLLPKKRLGHTRKSRRLSPVRSRILFAMVLGTFTHCFNNLIFFANNSGSIYGSGNMERICSTLHLPVFVSESTIEKSEELPRNSAADEAFN